MSQYLAMLQGFEPKDAQPSEADVKKAAEEAERKRLEREQRKREREEAAKTKVDAPTIDLVAFEATILEKVRLMFAQNQSTENKPNPLDDFEPSVLAQILRDWVSSHKGRDNGNGVSGSPIKKCRKWIRILKEME